MFIKIDIREKELIGKINQLILFIPIFKQLKVVTESLPLGDIIISDEKEDKIIIERKSINDLLSSIKDGRYEEQSYRLNGLEHHNHNIIYLIEGDVNKINYFKNENKTEKLTVYSAIFSLNYYKGFSVLRTFNMDETATFICNMANKLSKEKTSGKKAFYQNTIKSNNQNSELLINASLNTNTNKINDTNNNNTNNNNTNNNNTNNEIELSNDISFDTEQCDKDYINVVKKVKKENITTNNIGEIMLCQIPGISSVTAIAIINKFKSITNLIQEIQKDQNCLKDISYTNTKGQTRKITSTAITNIIKYLKSPSENN